MPENTVEKNMEIDMKKRKEPDGCRLHRAIIFATKAHSGQKRKGSNVDYICHPMEVLEILSSMGADYNLRIAGALHDTVEDTDATIEEIREQFGDDVANLVACHSEDKSRGWKERKAHTIAFLETADMRESMLIMADKLSNLRSMAADKREVGDRLWERFNSPKEMQAWYHGEVIKRLGRMPYQGHAKEAYLEMQSLYGEIFGQSE